MTGEAPALSGPEAPPLCARGGHPLGNSYHVGWPGTPGPICEDCWAEITDEEYNERQREAWEDHYAFLRECEG